MDSDPYPLTPDEDDRTEEINKYQKFKKVDGATYRKVNVFLRKRTYITAREWAIARLCSDFKTPYGAEMTFIGPATALETFSEALNAILLGTSSPNTMVR